MRAITRESEALQYPTEVLASALEDAERADFNGEVYPIGLTNILSRPHFDYLIFINRLAQASLSFRQRILSAQCHASDQ